jgi:hypothetical protein
MSDVFYTVRKLALPIPLLNQTEYLLKQRGELNCTSHHIVDLCMDKADDFNSLALYVSDTCTYSNLLSTVFCKKTVTIALFFKQNYWERICTIQNELNIGTGDVVRLILATYVFNSGTIALPLKELSRIFLSGRQVYRYNTILTEQVAGLLSETEKVILPMNREAIIRASHYYFTNGLGSLPKTIPEEKYRIDNSTTGWYRQTVTGSIEMKSYFNQIKETTGKTLAIAIAHATYSFLEQLREVYKNG